MKYFIVLIFIVLPLNTFAQDSTIRVITQDEWPPGKYVPVKVEIVNDNIDGFARFYQDLPMGFTVKKGNTSGADFYWDRNQVNFVWVKLPDTDTIIISYLAMADRSLSGSFNLGGVLDYVFEGDSRERKEISSRLISLNRNTPVEEVIEEISVDDVKEEPVSDDSAASYNPEVEFRVQVAVSSDQLSRSELESRTGCSFKHDITILKTGSVYKYQSGHFDDYHGASAYLESLKKIELKDAFIVAYRDDEQISVSLARSLTE
ncbi:MAG TPA: hypothetical protein VJ877_04805 [Bacteroidales bacterium]|nr:hypothetical protein [Bacteroidales bacterium]